MYTQAEATACKASVAAIVATRRTLLGHPGSYSDSLPAMIVELRRCIERDRKQKADRIEYEKGVAENGRQVEAALEARRQAKIRSQDAEAEAVRARERDEEAKAQRKSAIWSNPLILQTSLSACLCHDAEVRAATLAEIRKEQKYARIGGGIVDKSKLYELQGKLREVDDSDADTRSALKKIGKKVLGCSDRDVGRFSRCMRDQHGDECTPEVDEVVEEMHAPDFWDE